MPDVRRRFWDSRGEHFALAAMALVAVLLFAFTSFAARAFQDERHQLGRQWFQRGVAHLQAKQAAAAVNDFRNALVYNREDPQYSLRLAQALAAIGRTSEAEAYLLNLWERLPGDGTINLELARLAANTGRVEAAHRYYHNAVYGLWENDAEQQRRRVRWEMIEFLLARGHRYQAVAELASLLSDVPKSDVQARVRAGDLYRNAGEHERALAEYRKVLDLEADNPAALIGAGESAFALARYAVAERFLARASREDPKNTSVAVRLEVARAALQLDPYAYRLPAMSRAGRALRAFEITMDRLRSCAGEKALSDGSPATPLGEQYHAGLDLKRRMSPSRLRRDEAMLDSTMDFVFRSQQLAARECGAGRPADQALALLARSTE